MKKIISLIASGLVLMVAAFYGGWSVHTPAKDAIDLMKLETQFGKWASTIRDNQNQVTLKRLDEMSSFLAKKLDENAREIQRLQAQEQVLQEEIENSRKELLNEADEISALSNAELMHDYGARLERLHKELRRRGLLREN